MGSSRTEAGFSLLELLVSVAILLVAGAATVGAFAAVARNAQSDGPRALALMAAENAIAQARAAGAYAPQGADPAAAAAGDRSWALRPGATAYTVTAHLRGPATCSGATSLALALPVSATFDRASGRFSVAVTYPRDPCRVDSGGTIPADDALTLQQSVTLPPSTFAPGTVIEQNVAAPEQM